MNKSQFDGLSKKLLYKPAADGADKLCILTYDATPSMVSWLMNAYEEYKIKGVSIELIIASAADDGVEEMLHKSFKKLHRECYKNNVFSCSYLFNSVFKKDNYYIWLKKNKPIKAFRFSEDFMQKSVFADDVHLLTECNSADTFKIYEDAVSNSIFCIHSEIEDNIKIYSSNMSFNAKDYVSDENMVHLSLLAKNGETGKRSGLNWGHRLKRNRNEAYIPLPSKIARSGFFPLKKQHFLAVTDDRHTLQLRVEQQNDKAITTPTSNALLGEYFRNRLNLPNGAYVTKDDLQAYGRTDVTFYKIDEEQYYMDFSPKS